MSIFSSLVCYDAKWVPTGKEGTEMVEGQVVSSQFGKSFKGIKDGKDFYIPLDYALGKSTPTGLQAKGFKWIELGKIVRRWDNKFHDEDVKNSTETVYRVSELIL